MPDPHTDDALAERIAAHFGCGKAAALESLASLLAFAARQALEAAAPELLAAAEGVIEAADWHYDCTGERPVNVETLRDAVRKARGGKAKAQ
jgi:hypothetical protein